MVVAPRPDVVAAVIARLRSFSEITALTSTRITARSQPSWSGMPTYSVIARPRGGPEWKPNLNLMISRFDVLCYGATDAQSAALWRQLDAVLCPGQERRAAFSQTVDGVTCRVGSVEHESMPITGTEDETGWPRTSCTYLVKWLGIAT